MRARNILIIIAIVLILFNSLTYINGIPAIPQADTMDMPGKIAYMAGYNFLIIIALILLLIAFFIHRRIIRKRRKKLVDSFLE